MRRYFIHLLFVGLLLQSCTVSRQTASLNFKDYQIQKSVSVDSQMVEMLHPYTVKLDAAMNKVIGFSSNTFYAKQPESSIGNFLADCIKTMAEKKISKKIDAGFINQEGIRSYLSKGNITVGKVFEIMPFDNMVVLQEIKGSVLQQFLDKTASMGGWPVSKGVTLEIKDKKATNVIINGFPIDPNKTYLIANSDYVANGGNDCEMLRNIPKQDLGYLLRNAIMEYISDFTLQGKPIDPIIENRVINVN